MKSLDTLTQLYVATFNRSPDAAGILYWLHDSSLSLEEVATSFFDQPETQLLYPPNTNNASFINEVYQNLFNRSPDAEGLSYWEKELDSGNVPKSSFILAAINGAEAAFYRGQFQDYRTLENKKEVGLHFVEREQSEMSLAISSMSQVSSDYATVTAATEEIDQRVIISQSQGLEALESLSSSQRGQAASLEFDSNDILGIDVDSYASYVTTGLESGDNIFAVNLASDISYFIATRSNEDPKTLTVFDNNGRAVAYDPTQYDIPDANADVVLRFQPEYSGRYYIDASWEQSAIEPVGVIMVADMSLL